MIRLSCPKRWSFGILAGVAPLGIEQTLREMEQKRGAAHVTQVLEVEFNTLANDAGVFGDRRPDKVRGQLQNRIVVELSREPFLRQLDPISRNSREADFQ